MIGSVFTEIARRQPGFTAVVDGDVILTCRELADRRDVLVAGLMGQFGIAPGDRVAVSLPNCWQFVALFLALAELGGITVPLNPNWRGRELRWCLDTIRPTAVVASPEQAGLWRDQGYPADRIIDPPLVDLLSRPAVTPDRKSVPLPPTDHDHAVYLLTSGTSGFPKIVPRTHLNLAAGVRNVDAALGGVGRKRFISVVPFHHANGFANCMLLPLLTGGTVFVMERFLPRTLLEAVRRHQAQVLVGSPFIFKSMDDSAAGGDDLSSLEICLSSGAPIDAGVVRSWFGRFGIRVRQLYGSSETGTISIETRDAAADRLTAGLPVPSVEVRIDPGPVIRGDRQAAGELLVRSPAAMSGYLHQAGIGNGSVDGFFRTGDIGRFDVDGNIVLLGRTKRLINLQGIKVDPVEIEDLIRELPAVADCQVTSFDRGPGGEVIHARISVREGCSLSRREIVAHCRAHLAEHKIPRIIETTVEARDPVLGKRSLY